MAAITEHEQEQIDGANSSGRPPVVLVHELWLLSSSWGRWRRRERGQGKGDVATSDLAVDSRRDPTQAPCARLARWNMDTDMHTTARPCPRWRRRRCAVSWGSPSG